MNQVIAMHGWAGDHHHWRLWQRRFQAIGWNWICGEQGYSGLPPLQPNWSMAAERRVVIAHSLGWHLLPTTLLAAATDLVLLGGFGRFALEGAAGRAQRTGLAGMGHLLGTADETEMLKQFLARAASPLMLSALPTSPLLKGLTAQGRKSLRRDLSLLASRTGIPEGVQHGARVLALRGGQDKIVPDTVHLRLMEDLSLHLERPATSAVLNDCGHALIIPEGADLVLNWLEDA